MRLGKLFSILLFILLSNNITLFGNSISIIRDPFKKIDYKKLVKNVSVLEKEIQNVENKDLFSSASVKLKLTGIIWDEKDPKAIICIQEKSFFISKGDVIKEAFVSQISKGSVLFETENKTIKLELGQETIL